MVCHFSVILVPYSGKLVNFQNIQSFVAVCKVFSEKFGRHGIIWWHQQAIHKSFLLWKFPAIQYCFLLGCVHTHWDKVRRCWSKTYEECRTQLRWSTVQQRHQLLSCCQTFKIIHKLDCLNFDDYLCFNQSSTRSHSLTLRCARSRINSFRYSFFVNIPFLWNTIPYDIVNSTSYAAFKYKLKSFF